MAYFPWLKPVADCKYRPCGCAFPVALTCGQPEKISVKIVRNYLHIR